MKIEKGLNEFLMKRYGGFESAEITADNGKTVWLKIDCGDGRRLRFDRDEV